MKKSDTRNLNRLFSFYLVATSGPSMKEAARRLRVSVPTVSECMKRMQDDMGADLMHPEPRKTVLDEPGKVLLRRIGPAMELLESYMVEEKMIEARTVFHVEQCDEGPHEDIQAHSDVPEPEGRDQLLPGNGPTLAPPEASSRG